MNASKSILHTNPVQAMQMYPYMQISLLAHALGLKAEKRYTANEYWKESACKRVQIYKRFYVIVLVDYVFPVVH